MTEAGFPAGSDGPATGPLAGRTVVVTRAEAQAGSLAERLQALGASIIAAPCIVTEPPSDGGAALAAAIDDLESYSVVAVSSPTGAKSLVVALGAAGLEASALDGVSVAAVGPGTAAVLEQAGVGVDVLPAVHLGEGLLDELGDPPHPGARILIARAEVARQVLPQGLAERGWDVDVVSAYRTVAASSAGASPVDESAESELADRVTQADALTFTSSSTVSGFLARFGAQAAPPLVVCIGPIAAETARAAGLTVDVVADPHSLDGLVNAAVELFS